MPTMSRRLQPSESRIRLTTTVTGAAVLSRISTSVRASRASPVGSAEPDHDDLVGGRDGVEGELVARERTSEVGVVLEAEPGVDHDVTDLGRARRARRRARPGGPRPSGRVAAGR